jgi:hypothetical protein
MDDEEARAVELLLHAVMVKLAVLPVGSGDRRHFGRKLLRMAEDVLVPEDHPVPIRWREPRDSTG